MARLIYASNMSLDGWTEDNGGGFDWAPPDDDVFASITELMRSAGTYLYGRRMYETMAVWETMDAQPDLSPAMVDYARIWQAAEKVVYSTTLEAVSSERTRIERAFDPEAVRRLKGDAECDIAVGGPGLAGAAIAAGLVDELQMLIAPAVVGAGTRSLPDGVRLDLELVQQRRFGGGTVFLRYVTKPVRE